MNNVEVREPLMPSSVVSVRLFSLPERLTDQQIASLTQSRASLRAFLRAAEKRQATRLQKDECAQILDVRYRNCQIQCQVLWRSTNGVFDQPVWSDYAEAKKSSSFAACLHKLCQESQLQTKWSAFLEMTFPEDQDDDRGKQLSINGKRLPRFIELEKFDELEFNCYCILYARALQTGFIGPNFLEKFMEKRRVARFKQKRELQLKNLKDLSVRISEIGGISVSFENQVDLEEPPSFKYVNECFSDIVHIPDDPLVGCGCRSCNEYSDCCPQMSGSSTFPYKKNGQMRLPQGKAIYECNSRCKCDKRCPNRVVQHGPTVPFVVFKTVDRGWGLRATKALKPGQFVCEYVGEVIDCATADARGKVYDNIGLTYLFDLDYNNSDKPHTVDAYEYGNVSRFMNHSCDPNCAIWAVYINCLDPNLPRLGIFTRRHVAAGEELTFDYNVGSGQVGIQNAGSPKRVTQIGQCFCRARSCRKYLFDAAAQ